MIFKWVQSPDVDRGCMHAAVSGGGGGGGNGGAWSEVFGSGVSPSGEVGGGLFPVLAGGWGARVAYNFGHDLVNRPLRHAPLSADYISVAVLAAEQARGHAPEGD